MLSSDGRSAQLTWRFRRTNPMGTSPATLGTKPVRPFMEPWSVPQGPNGLPDCSVQNAFPSARDAIRDPVRKMESITLAEWKLVNNFGDESIKDIAYGNLAVVSRIEEVVVQQMARSGFVPRDCADRPDSGSFSTSDAGRRGPSSAKPTRLRNCCASLSECGC